MNLIVTVKFKDGPLFDQPIASREEIDDIVANIQTQNGIPYLEILFKHQRILLTPLENIEYYFIQVK